MSSELLKAFNTLKEKQWVDLTHIFGANSPHFSAFKAA
ncbi:MAG: cyclase family protein, partial [Psychrobacillus psychrodurans]